MYTSMTALAVATFMASANVEGPTWHRDYGKAQAVAAQAEKPLAVILAGGKNGFEKVVTAEETKQLLGKNYVCVYVDTQTESGKGLARRFQMSNGTGVVISDRTGGLQAYWHDGPISEKDLTRRLEKYADPNVVVATTETTGVQPSVVIPAAYSAPVAPPVAPSYAPAFRPTFAPMYSPIWSGGSCPNCR